MSYKDIVFNLVNEKVIEKFPLFKKKVFFAYEQVKAPSKPYLMINEINDETKHRTSEIKGIITEYKQATLSFRIAINGVTNGNNDPDRKYLAEDVRDYLRAILSSREVVDYFLENKMSNRFEFMSSNRSDHEPVNGGFVYVCEFDCPFDYEICTQQGNMGVSQGVNLNIDNKTNGISVEFEIKEKEIEH